MLTDARTFPCPACSQIINDSAEKCRYCSTPVDREAAIAAADIQDRVNQACSDASYLRTAAVTMFIFLGLSFVPFLPMVYWGFLFTFVALAVLLIRWQLRYRKIPTKDSDYHKAIKNRDLSFILWLVAIAAGFVIKPLLEMFLWARV
jgi:hypothetical protein